MRLAARSACVSAFAAIACLGACLYDPDDVCSPNQELKNGLCDCVEGAVPAADRDGCTLCGPDEVPAAGVCACRPGMTRTPEGDCAPRPAGLGEPCDATSQPCTEADYDYCRPTEGTSGYCTSQGCATSDDCATDYACVEEGSVRFCKRPPTGVGLPCQSSADCAGYDASYCETFQSHMCLVSDCTVTPNNCHEGWECCDLTSLGLGELLCVPEGFCPTA